jgi:Ser/Thr protein kinase RdoA (MazF antagonist)
VIIPRAPKALALRIDRYWNGAACPDKRLHGAVTLSSTPAGLCITATLPHQASPNIPPQPPGTRVANLWEYDVVECFIVGSRKYLEVELGAGGHFLVLDFCTRAPRVREHEYVRFCPALAWLPSVPQDPRRWRSSIVIPWEMVPKRAHALNAFVIVHDHFLAYRPTGGSAPNFHQPWAFPKVSLLGAPRRQQPRPRSILGRFPIPSPDGVERFGTGLINPTYRVRAGEREFVLQRLHEIVSTDAVEDMRIVTEHLAQRGMRVPHLMRSEDGQVVVPDVAGGRWRLYPLIPGRTVDALESTDMAVEAGRIVGTMHRHLLGLSLEPKGSIEHFHDTRHVLDKLRGVVPKLPRAIRDMAEDMLATVPGIILTEDSAQESRQIIHGDLKISNILFDDAGRAVGIIDFDTIMRHFRSIDFGDSLRSWCNRTSEDDPQATFDVGIFQAAMTGYEQGWGAPVREEEKRIFLRATLQITYELASRFLIDVVGDHYFGYREPYTSRRAANLARAIGQYHLAKTIPYGDHFLAPTRGRESRLPWRR